MRMLTTCQLKGRGRAKGGVAGLLHKDACKLGTMASQRWGDKRWQISCVGQDFLEASLPARKLRGIRVALSARDDDGCLCCLGVACRQVVFVACGSL